MGETIEFTKNNSTRVLHKKIIIVELFVIILFDSSSVPLWVAEQQSKRDSRASGGQTHAEPGPASVSGLFSPEVTAQMFFVTIINNYSIISQITLQTG